MLALWSALLADKTRLIFAEPPLLGIISVLAVHILLIYQIIVIARPDASNFIPFWSIYVQQVLNASQIIEGTSTTPQGTDMLSPAVSAY
ncbi:unnamed protein product [Anisakis simplex]|uniref:Uncharacterized protein n=1 Tax=Anisakis simplex TaxID=6269 RepID=A0A0M3JXN5_ANISI|nr:unnamed protein product [Anisakis simplex]